MIKCFRNKNLCLLLLTCLYVGTNIFDYNESFLMNKAIADVGSYLLLNCKCLIYRRLNNGCETKKYQSIKV